MRHRKVKYEEAKVFKDFALKDSDGDRVYDIFDCQPHNPKKQDAEYEPNEDIRKRIAFEREMRERAETERREKERGRRSEAEINKYKRAEAVEKLKFWKKKSE